MKTTRSSYPHAGFVIFSFMAHIMVFYPAVSPGVLEFGSAVSSSQVVLVELGSTPPPQVLQANPHSGTIIRSVAPPVKPVATSPAEPGPTGIQENAPEHLVEEAVIPEDIPAPSAVPPAAVPIGQTPVVPVVSARPAPVIQPPLRKVEEFLGREQETLTYQVNLRGVPVGSAVLEASSAGGEFRISLKMNSGPALSTLYPVHNQIETRHIGGNFIITKIRRQEGSRRSDNGFTISLRDRSVFWVDLLKRRSSMEKIPTSDVLDPFSALYYLRNRPLQVGKTEVLHVYDGDSYAELPVEVLRAELIHLPGKGDTQTLVLKPQLRNEAVFHRTGEMLVWVTADEFKVPLKVETSILLGKVTAELVAAETAPLPSSRSDSLQ